MPASLSELPDELHLKIVDALLAHDEWLHEESFKGEYEVLTAQQDDTFMQHRDLMNWSCTSAFFRNLLAPSIFKAVKLRNDERSGASIEALSKSPHGTLIKEIHFVGTIPGIATETTSSREELSDSIEVEERNDGIDEIDGSSEASEGYNQNNSRALVSLSTVTENLLSDLSRFTSLESLSIGFKYPYNSSFSEYYDDMSDEDYDKTDDIDPPSKAQRWQAMMDTTYSALCRTQSKHPPFKALDIRKFVWTHTVPFATSAFQELLTHMESFTLSVRGDDNGAGWSSSTIDEYLDCVAGFDSTFFTHLRSATSFTLKATEEGAIGLEGMRHTRLALYPGAMPKLRQLHLDYIYICEELLDFAKSLVDTLEEIKLYNCYSSVNGLQENEPFYWRDLFDGLLSVDMKRLRLLEISPLQLPIDEESVMEEAKAEAKPQQQTDQKRRAFAYGFNNDKYGALDDDDEEILDAYQRGDDQAAFDKLQEKIKGNALDRK